MPGRDGGGIRKQTADPNCTASPRPSPRGPRAKSWAVLARLALLAARGNISRQSLATSCLLHVPHVATSGRLWPRFLL